MTNINVYMSLGCLYVFMYTKCLYTQIQLFIEVYSLLALIVQALVNSQLDQLV